MNRDDTTLARRRARLACTAALTALSGAAAGLVFDRADAALLMFAVVPSAVIGATDVVSVRARRALHVLAALVVAAVATAVTGGRVPERTVDGVVRGWSLAISTDWPSPLRPELVAFISVVIALAAAAGVELVLSRRARAAVLVPPALLALLLLALAAPAGPPPMLGVAGWLLLAAAVLATGDPNRHRLALRDRVRSEGRATVSLILLAAVAAALVVAAPAQDRSDPRDGAANPLVTSDELSPLAQVAADRELVTAEPRFTVDGPITGRWRTRVLDRFDGVSWTSAVTVRPVSRDRISEPSSDGTLTRQRITTVGAPMAWVPIAGVPVSSDLAVESDADRSMLALEVPIEPGASIVLELVPSADRSQLEPGDESRRQPDEEAAPFAALAQSLGGDEATLLDRLIRLEQALRDDYRLASDVAAGTNVALLQYALEDSRQGTPEQFVAAFALMVRSLGASSRIAIGYDVPEQGTTVTSAESVAWPEVYFEGHGWVAFDPIPTETAAGPNQGNAPRQAVPADLAPPPPAVNPPLPDDPDPEPTTSPSSPRSAVVTVMIVAATVLGGLLLMLAAAAAAVVLVKSRRRRRRLRVARSEQLVLGAWAEATDHLVELGADLLPHHTNREMVEIGAQLVAPRAHAPLADLGGLANAAAHGGRPPDPIVAAHAVRLLGQVEQVIGETEPRRRRWRMRVSTRSVRSGSRSPVR